MYKPRGSVSNWFSFRLAAAAFAFASVFAVAQQQQPGCAPNTANYPCVYVANGGGSTVSIINATTGKVIGAVPVGKLPRGLAITPDNAFVYVAVVSGSTVVVLDTATGAVSATVTGLTGQSPTQVAITPDGKFAYVVEVAVKSPVIDRIDTANNTVVDSVAGLKTPTSPSAIVISPSGTLAYVAAQCSDPTTGTFACVAVVDTTISPPTVTFSISIPNFTGTGSIAITPDGSVVCVTVVDPNLKVGVACINTTNDLETELDLGTFVGLTSYGLAATPNGTMYGAEPGDPSGGPLSVVAELDPNTTPPTLLNNIQVGLGPTGVAIGPGGLSVYVTDADDNTVSIIDAATNAVVILGSGNGFSNPQGLAAMSASPPVITTQPASQIISPGQTATLSVVATSAASIFYQWFQGLAGDTSFPIRGAVASSFTTPPLASTTSYWVQVSNVAGTVNSNTATVTVTSNQPPTCTLSVAGNGSQDFSNPLTVIATATCVDPQGEALTTTIDFGDGASSTSGNNGVFTASHTYAAYTQQISYNIFVTATDTSELQSAPAQYSWTLVPTALAPPVFAGQSSNVTVMLASPSGQSELVMFQCATVTTTSGATPTQASALGISCSSNPPTITLTAASQPVTLVIQTTGAAVASAPSVSQRTWSYAFWVPLPILAFLGIGFTSIRSNHSRYSFGLALSGLLVLALLTVSCGGGFTAPKVIQATPAGNYQVTIIDVPVSSTTSGFVQTSLIVPLTVSPFQ